MDWYVGVLKKYAEFKGRARRKEYWMFFLINMIVGMILSFGDAMLGFTDEGATGPLYGLYGLAVFIPALAVGIRRMHDTDHSGWWIIVPFVNFIFAVLPGTAGPNRFGSDPKSSEPAFGAPTVSGYAAPPAPPAPPAPSVPVMPPMTPAPALPAAGWLPDPTQRHELRYWDGAQWTENVSSGGVTGTDPL